MKNNDYTDDQVTKGTHYCDKYLLLSWKRIFGYCQCYYII
jgi:hypothetical protein